MEIISRKQAIIAGKKRYFTGVPCSNGHIEERSTSGWTCLQCKRDTQAKFRKENNVRYKELQLKHKDLQRKCKKLWNARNPDKIREHHKRSYEKNKEKRKKSCLEWARKNPHKAREIRKRWETNNPEKHKISVVRKQANRRGAKGRHTIEEITKLMESQKNRCAECKKKISVNPKKRELKANLDHILPIKLGGSNSKDNLQWLCYRCNLSKSYISPTEWAKRNGRLI